MALAFLLAAASAAAMIALPIVHARQQTERNRLRGGAIPASATVTAVNVTRGEHPRRDVTYRYVAAGREYDQVAQVAQRDRRPLVVGSRLPIIYLDSDPARSWLPGAEPGVLPLWVVPLVTCSLAVFSAALFWRIHRDRVLLADGRLAQGRVLESTKVRHQHHHAHRVRYVFTTLSGATVTATAERRQAPGAVGDAISVLYHRDDPRWNAIYPLALVAPAVQN
jgi:hypothetical protein